MRYVSDWVAEWVEGPMPGAEEAENLLTDLGLEVEGVVADADIADRVVIGQVLEKSQHPNADRLTVCRVDVGEEEPVQIVCGAPNHRAGDRVVVARPGCRLPGDFRIKKSKIRGEVSLGMMCSEKELGLGESHEGILILPTAAEVGQPFSHYLRSAGRQVFELSITANRGDALSMVGLARELCVRSADRRPRALIDSCVSAGEPHDLRIELHDDGCPFYAAKLLRKVRLGPSPAWMQSRLAAAGIRSISNVVDITNYVLLSYGQPLHAFDAGKLSGASMGVRRAQAGETLETLDGVTRTLDAEDLVVVNGARAVALAGVMGGAATEVRDGTTEVLLEAAYFDPASIRRTARRHALHSDSSHRFERCVDPQRVVAAMNYAAHLMVELCGAEAAPGYSAAGEPPSGPAPIEFRLAQAEALAGMPFAADWARTFLEALGCQVAELDEAWSVAPPSWRSDISRPVDLVEELVRGIGLDAVPERLPTAAPPTAPLSTEDHGLRVAAQLRDDLVARGYHEAVSLAFMSPRWQARLEAKAVPLDNPLGDETSFMRSDLRPALIEAMARNRRHGRAEAQLVEFGSIFDEDGERLMLAWACPAGPDALAGYQVLRADVEAVLLGLGIRGLHFEPDSFDPLLHPRSAAEICVGARHLGRLGELHPELRDEFSLGDGLWLVQLDVQALRTASCELAVFSELPRFPAVHRDLALLIDETRGAGHLADVAAEVDRDLRVSARVFDVYRGDALPKGKKSVAVRFSIQSAAGTLNEKEVNRWLKGYERLAKERFDAELRA